MRKTLPLITICLVTLMWSLGINAQPFISNGTGGGDWSSGTTWNQSGATPGIGDNVIILASDVVTLSGTVGCNDLQIDVGGSISGGTNTLVVNGDLVINGSISAIGTLVVNKVSGIINGSGSVTVSTNFIANNDHTISSGADLSITGNLQINDPTFFTPATLTNNGTLTISGNIAVGSSNESFVNSNNAVLNVGGSLVSTGNLNASGTDNLINYTSSGSVTVKSSDVGNYQNLQLSGGGTYTLPSAMTIDEDLTVTSGTLSTGNFDLTLSGNFTNSGTFTPGSSTITFNGAASQSVALGGSAIFENMVVNNSGGGISADNNIAVSNTLTMTSGNINMSGNTITLGTDIGNEGTLTFTSGRIIGSFERWINSTPGGGFTFPIGVSANDRTMVLVINTLSAGGSVTASFVPTGPGNAGMPFTDPSGSVEITSAFADGYWDLTTVNGFGMSDYNLDLTGDGFSSPPAIDADTRLIIRNNAGANWGANGSHVAATGTTAQRDNMTTFTSGQAQYAFGDDTPCTPPTTSAISGDATVCTGETPSVYSVTLNGANTYAWSITGGTIDSGQGTNSISVTWGSTGQVGNLMVIESDGACSGDPVSLDVTINTIAPTAITGETEAFERDIEAYSVTNTAGYTYTWTITNGTLLSGDGTNAISVDWDEIVPDLTTNVTGTVSVVAQATGCSAAPAFEINVNVRNTIIADVNNGQWNVGTTWIGDVAPADPDDKVLIPTGIKVNTTAARSVRDLTVESGATLQIDGNMTVSGNLVLDGLLTNVSTNRTLIMSGTDTSPLNSISGTGDVTFIGSGGAISMSNEDKQILAGTDLTLSDCDIVLVSSIAITNLGSIATDGVILGGSATWTNGVNSSLSFAPNALLPFTGNLSASAADNTVIYTGSDNFTIIQPTDSYFNITFAGTGTASLGANLTVGGDLNLQSGTLATTTSNFRINLEGDWNNTGGTFTEQQGTLDFNGTGDQLVINTSGEETFHFVEVDKASGTLTVQNGTNMRISGVNLGPGPGIMTFTSGIVNTSATGLLIFNDGSSTTGASATSFVDGPVRKVGNTAFEFPIGDGSIWAPLSVSDFQGAAATEEVTVEYFDQPFSNTTSFGASGLNNVSLVEYWDVSAAGGFTVDLTFFWKDIDRSSIDDANDLRIAHWNGASWDDLGKLAVPTLGTEGNVTADNVGSFSPFTFGSSSSSSNPLPVELLSFEANLVENQTELTWSTASEINNDFFLVQRSEDGTEWETLGEVDGNGTVNEIINYGFWDTRPLFGKSFYRLKQVDFDGQFEYSPVVSVNNPFTGNAMRVMVYPNPTSAENINLRVLTGNQENKISIQLIDALGHRFIDEKMSPDAFNEDLIIRANEGLSKGVYFLMVTQNNSVVKQRLIVD
ncbi:T9SS type A sorting domain-containing protein [Fulvivirgaceae bacterium BMA12]|uniref:T9SS type A sorting domain-containing protein n=1 Tax=Agaribacillus aureus TaxID=3051825 RepID=A0ABT8L2Y3_9BACT|nr:T9SS type A sorting domain-containing protein [Fulvivirgaceae bacterium BMA12]